MISDAETAYFLPIAINDACSTRRDNMDIVASAVELFEDGKYEEAYELSAQFDRYQQDTFFKATGVESDEDLVLARIRVGAYKIEKEKDAEKKQKMLGIYDALVSELEQLRKGEIT